MRLSNIFENIPVELPEEEMKDLLERNNFRIERIVSRGHSSPDGFWYEQETSEFVMLLSGGASLLFEGDDAPLAMKPGDYLTIPARKRHRVESTDASCDSVWLAVHFE